MNVGERASTVQDRLKKLDVFRGSWRSAILSRSWSFQILGDSPEFFIVGFQYQFATRFKR